jgi:hypothetical protein
MQKAGYRYSRLRHERKKKRTVTAALGAVLIVVSVVFVARAPFLRVQAVNVTGARAQTAMLVQQKAQHELNGSYFFVFPKDNILWFPKAEIAKSVKENVSQIKKASVAPAAPQSISVVVEEYTAQAFTCNSLPEQEECFLLDNGLPFTTTTISDVATASSSYFQIKNNGEEIKMGRPVVSAKTFLFFSELHSALIKENISVAFISPQKGQDILVRTKEGTDILFSSKQSIAESIKNLTTLLSSDVFKKENLTPPDGWQKINSIDVRFGNKLYYTVHAKNSGNVYEESP